MEKELLSAVIEDRKVWEELVGFGETGSSFSDLGKVLWKYIDTYYKLDKQASNVNKNVLLAKLEAVSNEKTFEVLKDVIGSLPRLSISNVRDSYAAQRLSAVGQALSAAILSRDATKTDKLLEEYNNLKKGNLGQAAKELDLYDSSDTRHLLDVINRTGLMPIRPLALNDRLDGGACKGDHILISGRVENGKSLVAINAAAGLAHDGFRGLVVCNEDAPRRMRPRFLSRFSGLTKHEIARDVDFAIAKAKANGYDNIVFANQAPNSPLSPIAKELETGKYDFVVIDQIRNIGSEDDNKAGKLEEAALGMRDLCKKYDVLGISVTQSLNGFMQINKLICDMGDVADSKHGLPGQADLIIMLGTNEEFRDNSQLMLNVVKNKISGAHFHMPVTINKALSKVEEYRV